MALIPWKAAFLSNMPATARNPTLLTLAGVQCRVLRTIMQWSLKRRGWQAPFSKMALLTGLWLLMAFVFATEFYLSARSGPLRITWMTAFAGTFRDWFPLVLLSPVTVVLAEKCRFDRNTWKRKLLIHLAACFLFTIVYEGLLLLASPAPFMVSTGGVSGSIGMISTAEAMPPGQPGFGGSIQVIQPPELSFPPSSNDFLHEPGTLRVEVGRLAVPENSNIVTIVHGSDGPVHASPNRHFRVGFMTFSSANKWTHFLHLTMIRTQFTIPIYLCIVCVCWVINYFQEANDRERRTLELETRLNQANLQALKMQLQPHFLFNTLNAISSLIHENPKAADDMIGSLSQFLRSTLDISTRNEVPLRMEMEFVDRYLEIQQTRFGDRLRIHREVEPAVIEALVPPLILQPLVENAIRYGIESRETGGTVCIQAVRKGDLLHLEISDDGEGFSANRLLQNGNGIGLSNTKARLQELYGRRHQFKVTANQPRGACVKIEIPFLISESNIQRTHEHSHTHC
jgi:two-component sensor histidine kinase